MAGNDRKEPFSSRKKDVIMTSPVLARIGCTPYRNLSGWFGVVVLLNITYYLIFVILRNGNIIFSISPLYSVAHTCFCICQHIGMPASRRYACKLVPMRRRLLSKLTSTAAFLPDRNGKTVFEQAFNLDRRFLYLIQRITYC